MADPVLHFVASVSPNVNKYNVAWTVNGTQAGSISIARDPAADTAGYATPFSAANPSVTLNPGDVLTATAIADDTVDSLLSSVATASPYTVPTPITAPQPPTGLVISAT